MDKLIQIIESDAAEVVKKVDLSPLLGKRVLITGASGLIGQNLLASLKIFLGENASHTEVFAICQSRPTETLTKLMDYPGGKILIGDLTREDFLKSLPEADFIIHAAGYAQPGRFLANPVKTLKLNTSATFALVEKLRAGGKFLFISSSEIYSGLPNPPYLESQTGSVSPEHPRACYIYGKLGGEAICNAYRLGGIAAKSARVSLVYGPGARPGDTRALYNFIDKALTEKEIKLIDRGLANRSYCYVTDIAEMLWKVLLYGKEAVYNVGGRSQVTIFELAEKIGEYLGVPVAAPEAGQGLAGSPLDVSVDISRLERELGKMDFVNLDEGLKRTIKWQKALNH